jgi:hypothetical protein
MYGMYATKSPCGCNSTPSYQVIITVVYRRIKIGAKRDPLFRACSLNQSEDRVSKYP